MKKITKISDLTPDPRNANKGTERGRNLLDDSLRNYGAGRSILVDKNGVIIAGNKTIETAADIGIKDVVVVQTDGNKIVAVQRVDLDLATDPKAVQLAIADNRVSQMDLDWDASVIQELVSQDIEIPGFSDEELSAMFEGLKMDDGIEYDESIANDVKTVTCPKCGEVIPI